MVASDGQGSDAYAAFYADFSARDPATYPGTANATENYPYLTSLYEGHLVRRARLDLGCA